jgi:hypothetical protein
MTNSMWQRTEELAKQHDQQGGSWIRLQNDGDTTVVVFLGEPYPRQVCFVDGKYHVATEELKAAGHKASLRVALNVFVLETKEVKVLEQGVVFFKDLVRVRDKYGLSDWAFDVTRNGAAKDPKTRYSILPERQLSPEEKRVIQGLKLHDLAALYGEAEAEDEPEFVDEEVARQMVGQLKLLPRQAAERFCQKFGVERVRDLKRAHVETAWELIVALQKEFNPSAAPDPFS